jgi:NADH:ubiquinone oxidoreductase subunit 3 (subunit A)
MSKPSKTKYYILLIVLIIFNIFCIFAFGNLLWVIESGSREEISTGVGILAVLGFVTYSINNRYKQIKEDMA